MEEIYEFLNNPESHDEKSITLHHQSDDAYFELCNTITMVLKGFLSHDTMDSVMDNNKPDKKITDERYHQTFAEWVFHDNKDNTTHYRLRVEKLPSPSTDVAVTLQSLEREIEHEIMSLEEYEENITIREEYEDLVADCEKNLETVTYAAEIYNYQRARLNATVNQRARLNATVNQRARLNATVNQRERLKHAFDWYDISVKNLIAFQRKQQHQRQLDSYDFEHLTMLCNSDRQVIQDMKEVYSFLSSEQ